MARLTLRLPDEIYQRLCAAARRKGISLNQAILETLDRDLLPAPATAPENETPEERERRLMHQWIAGSHRNDDFSALPPHLHPDHAPRDREAFLRSLPKLDPPLSHTVIQEREESRY